MVLGFADCQNLEEVQISNGGPVIGEYSQFDNSTICYHLHLAVAAKFDGYILNWNPSSEFQSLIIDNMFREAERLNRDYNANRFDCC